MRRQMLTNKPGAVRLEVSAHGSSPLVRLSDYESLATECEKLRAEYEEELFQLRQTRDAHFGELMRALEQVDALQAENALLRAAIRRLCNLYEVDDYYMGQLREERLEAAVNRAIEQVKETIYENQ